MSFPNTDIQEPEFNREKFEAAVQYICSEVDDIRQLSLTKLHKILYYADREAYLALGEALTGETYVKADYGPMSEHLRPTLTRLEEEDEIKHIEKRGHSSKLGTYTQNCYVATRPPELDIFKPEEVQLLSETAQLIQKNFTSEEVSDLSHDVVWRSVKMGEPLPYYTALLQATEPVTGSEVREWGREKAEELFG